MNLEKLHKYAEVVVKRGLYIEPGQPVYIEAQVDFDELVAVITEEAYKAGASDVSVNFKSNQVDRIKMLNAGDKMDALSEIELATIDYYSKKHAAFLRIEKVDLDIFKGIDVDVIAKKAIGDRQSRVRYSKNSNDAQGCIICCPSKSWAKVVYPDMDEDEALEKLWEAVFECCRLSEADPIAAWDKYVENSRKRRKLLEEANYETLHYTSSETDLYLTPTKPQMWVGGCVEYPNSDKWYIPNVPTEEVFTIPHKTKAQGYVTSTRPLNYRGQIIDHFKLVLKDGKVVDYSADKGYEFLKSIIETDEGSCYFGEMALIDKNSPISAMKTTFYTTLFDENASCHIALGLSGAFGGKSKEELEAMGFNQSIIHVDFMIGSDDMNIKGLKADGSWEDIFINGSWAEKFCI